jgi:hypothetical protein
VLKILCNKLPKEMVSIINIVDMDNLLLKSRFLYRKNRTMMPLLNRLLPKVLSRAIKINKASPQLSPKTQLSHPHQMICLIILQKLKDNIRVITNNSSTDCNKVHKANRKAQVHSNDPIVDITDPRRRMPSSLKLRHSKINLVMPRQQKARTVDIPLQILLLLANSKQPGKELNSPVCLNPKSGITHMATHTIRVHTTLLT